MINVRKHLRNEEKAIIQNSKPPIKRRRDSSIERNIHQNKRQQISPKLNLSNEVQSSIPTPAEPVENLNKNTEVISLQNEYEKLNNQMNDSQTEELLTKLEYDVEKIFFNVFKIHNQENELLLINYLLNILLNIFFH